MLLYKKDGSADKNRFKFLQFAGGGGGGGYLF